MTTCSLRNFIVLSMLISAPALGQSRAFMDAAGNAGAGQPTTGPTIITMAPGTSQEIEVWVVDDSPLGSILAAYQMIFQCTSIPQPGATGSIDYVDNNPGVLGGDSLVVDTVRADWVFANSIAPVDPTYSEECPRDNVYGVVYFTVIPTDNVDINATAGSSPRYLASFTIEASADACGTHEFRWNRSDTGVPPLAALFGRNGSQWLGDESTPAEFQNLLIQFGPSNDTCSNAIDLGDTTTVDQPFDTTCATVDGPQGCASGSDLWFLYQSSVPNPLMVDVTAGDYVVYPAPDGCPPTTPGFCSNEMPPVGENYLIQVIGDDVQGVLSVQVVCCLDSASCDDDNPCTDDICVCDCENLPNTDPCNDGDPCTIGDTCAAGACQPGRPANADDANPCTNDFCLPGKGIQNEDINGMACTIDDDCNIGSVSGAICDNSVCVCPCDAGCCDDNGDGIRDDGCVWCQCDGLCGISTGEIDIVFADMGGPFGDCFPDGVADNNDSFHALNCFANVSVDGIPGAYACESDPPAAVNVDAGGAFGDCSPDGVCDGNDSFLALNTFAGLSSCSCPLDGGPMPSSPDKPHVVDRTSIRLVTDSAHASTQEEIVVRAYLDRPVSDLRGYQLHVTVSGGRHGTLDLVDIAIDQTPAFAGLGPWTAFNVATAQMVAGLSSPGVAVPSDTYLATFILRPTRDARGSFVIDLLYDDDDPAQRTFLFPTAPRGRIELTDVTPAIVTIGRKNRTR